MATKDKGFYLKKTLNLNGKIIALDPPVLMGILNLTPDSFYDGGRYETLSDILRQSEKLVSEGAHMIDIGGYSTRPGAENISVEEEWKRLRPALDALARNFPETPLSVDTFRAAVARRSIEHGAAMINDISGGTLDPDMLEVISDLQVPYVLMHMRGDPRTMQTKTNYEDVVINILTDLEKKLSNLTKRGVNDVILDVGFGFAKTMEQNYRLLSNLNKFRIFGKPLLVGISRKSMVWKLLDISPEEALNGTTALHMVALMKGASVLRVHDVAMAAQVIKLYKYLYP